MKTCINAKKILNQLYCDSVIPNKKTKTKFVYCSFVDKMIDLNLRDELTEYIRLINKNYDEEYEEDDDEDDEINIFYMYPFPELYNAYFNKIVQYEKIPDDILQYYLKKLNDDEYYYLHHKMSNEDIFWIDVMINKYNYTFSNMNQFIKTGYYKNKINTIEHFITIFLYNDLYEQYYNNIKMFEILLKNNNIENNFDDVLKKFFSYIGENIDKDKCRIKYIYIEKLIKIMHKTSKLTTIHIQSLLEILSTVSLDDTIRCDDIVDILLNYKLSENIYKKLLKYMTSNLTDNIGQNIFGYLCARLFFEQKNKIIFSNMQILDGLDSFLDYWGCSLINYGYSIYYNHSKNYDCCVSFNNFLLNYMYDYIKKETNTTHEELINGIDLDKYYDEKEKCDNNYCIYKKYNMSKKYNKDISNKKCVLANKIKIKITDKLEKLEIIKRGYTVTLDIEEIEELDNEIVMKYLCMNHNYATIKYLLSNKKIIVNIKHLIYMFQIYPIINSKIIKLLVEYCIPIDKNFIDILYNSYYDFPNNTIFDILIRDKANEYNYKVPKNNYITNNNKISSTHKICKLFLQSYDKFINSISKIDISKKLRIKYIEKIKPYFYASMYNTNIMIFEYLIEKFQYIPTIDEINEIYDSKRKYLLLKRFGY